MNKVIFIIIFLTANCFLLCIHAFAQRQITAKVEEEATNKPVENASIKVVGKDIQTTTDRLGYFQLTLDDFDILQVYSDQYEFLSFILPSQDKFKVELKKKEISIYADGMDFFYLYLRKNISFPPKAFTSKKYGTVYVSFQIDEIGGIQNIITIHDIGKGCGHAVQRGLKDMPSRFITENPETVYILPVKFRIANVRNKKNPPVVEIPKGIMLEEIEISVIRMDRIAL